MTILIIGSGAHTGIGGSLLRAANKQGIAAHLIESGDAYRTNWLSRRIYWHMLGRRPYYLRQFSQRVVNVVREKYISSVIATGIAPLDAIALGALQRHGVTTLNFLTDDPWNRLHHAPWFLHAVPIYDCVFTPRRANISDLCRAGCSRVRYLPFGYDEDIFYKEPVPENMYHEFESDVYFAGGADGDRVPYMAALIKAGFNLRLHGGYWSRYTATRAYGRGIADPTTLRLGLNTTKIGLCLVRRANRDGNCMRTFEVPASGACLLTEDTSEHREIFGADGETALFFSSIDEMVDKARMLLADTARRKRIASAGYDLITRGGHRYRDRLLTMLAAIQAP